MEFLKDLFSFMWQRKVFWLVPVILVLLIVGIIIVVGGTAAGGFMYTLF